MFAHANADIHVDTCTDVHATMHTNTLTLANSYTCKQVGMHAVIASKKYVIQMCEQTLPPLPFILTLPF